MWCVEVLWVDVRCGRCGAVGSGSVRFSSVWQVSSGLVW